MPLYRLSIVFIMVCHWINRCAKIKTANTISVGFAWDRGNPTARHGIIAIDMMRTKRRLHVMLRKNYGRRLQGDSFSFRYHIRFSRDKRFFLWSSLVQFEMFHFTFRYLHYYNRYMNHMQSLKFEHKLYNCIKEKMEEMQQHNMSWIEVSILMTVAHIFIGSFANIYFWFH